MGVIFNRLFQRGSTVQEMRKIVSRLWWWRAPKVTQLPISQTRHLFGCWLSEEPLRVKHKGIDWLCFSLVHATIHNADLILDRVGQTSRSVSLHLRTGSPLKVMWSDLYVQ